MVDEKAIQDVLRARKAYDRSYSWISDPILIAVTNGSFTLAAHNLAREHGVITMDRAELPGLPVWAKNQIGGGGRSMH